jgi:protease PrsW
VDRLAILFCAMAPAIILLLYGITKARGRWDDAAIWPTFVAGGLCAMFTLLPEFLLDKTLGVDGMRPVPGALTESLVIAAIPEEIAKFIAFLYAEERYSEGARLQDVMTLTLAIAMGFAAIENLGYLAGAGNWQPMALSRAITAVPSHAIDGLIMGALLTATRLDESRWRLWLPLALVLPILLHAGYDFPLLLVAKDRALYGVLPAWLVMSVLAMIGVLYLCNKMRAAARLADRRTQPAEAEPPPSFSPKRAAAAILLVAPLLAAARRLIVGHASVFNAGVVSLLPIILGVDLLCTSPAPARSSV